MKSRTQFSILFEQMAESPGLCVGYAGVVALLILLLTLVSLVIWPGEFAERLTGIGQVLGVGACVPVALWDIARR